MTPQAISSAIHMAKKALAQADALIDSVATGINSVLKTNWSAQEAGMEPRAYAAITSFFKKKSVNPVKTDAYIARVALARENVEKNNEDELVTVLEKELQFSFRDNENNVKNTETLLREIAQKLAKKNDSETRDKLSKAGIDEHILDFIKKKDFFDGYESFKNSGVFDNLDVTEEIKKSKEIDVEYNLATERIENGFYDTISPLTDNLKKLVINSVDLYLNSKKHFKSLIFEFYNYNEQAAIYIQQTLRKLSDDRENWLKEYTKRTTELYPKGYEGFLTGEESLDEDHIGSPLSGASGREDGGFESSRLDNAVNNALSGIETMLAAAKEHIDVSFLSSASSLATLDNSKWSDFSTHDESRASRMLAKLDEILGYAKEPRAEYTITVNSSQPPPQTGDTLAWLAGIGAATASGTA